MGELMLTDLELLARQDRLQAEARAFLARHQARRLPATAAARS
jgi:hypothetical protein